MKEQCVTSSYVTEPHHFPRNITEDMTSVVATALPARVLCNVIHIILVNMTMTVSEVIFQCSKSTV